MQIQETKDGSHTLISKEFGELYHSHNGSIQEAQHIFIKNGLQRISSKNISVFEMGFGSGLNAILSYFFAEENDLKIDYTTIEAYPIDVETAVSLNYNEFLKFEGYRQIFPLLHKVGWNKKIEISKNFSFHKILIKIEDIEIEYLSKVDVVFYDAFAPNAQANLWETEVLTKMYKLLKPNAFLITYCAKGVFKRTLKSIGFEVVALDGPIGKREISMAIKKV